MVPKIDERHLVAEVKEPETYHPTINNWKHVLTEQQKKICWDHLYEKDQSNRAVEDRKNKRKRKPDNLETNLEEGEALEGQSRYESQPPYSPFQPRDSDESQPHENPFQRRDESQPQSSPFQSQDEQERERTGTREPFKCYLINHNGNNDVVAIGFCYTSRVSLHNVPLKPGEVVVTVSEVKIDIPLWAPEDEIEMLRNAIGAFIVWPKEMVLQTGTDEEEEREQTGSGGNPGKSRYGLTYGRRNSQRKGQPPRTGNPGKSRYGRRYKQPDRYTPASKSKGT